MKKIKLTGKLALNKVKVAELNNAAQKNIIGGKDYISGKKCFPITTMDKFCWVTEAPSGCGACFSYREPCTITPTIIKKK